MSLTLKIEQALESAGLVQFFNDDAHRWTKVARETYAFLKAQYPKGGAIRADDVAIVLVPTLEVNEALRNFLEANKLTQKYWFRSFADLILDRAWPSISK
ncbi:MAG TPA: hypothetical protein VJN96_04425 [Vicinamibacterales bacterium]|nr:hypothetical protein [Vicinamibacterales bacterium]